MKIFETHELSPKVIYEVKNVETAWRAAAGFGLTIVPEICLKFLSSRRHPTTTRSGILLERHVVMLYQRDAKLSAPEQTLCGSFRALPDGTLGGIFSPGGPKLRPTASTHRSASRPG